MFKRVEIYDQRTLYEGEESSKPYMRGLAEIERDPESIHDKVRFLKIEMNEPKELSVGRIPEFGDVQYIDRRRIKESELSVQELKECEKLKENYDRYRNSAVFTVHGTIYEDKPSFYKWDDENKHPYWKDVENKDFECPPDVKTLEDVEKWVLENHPDYYMGYSASQNIVSGDFIAGAVPSSYYPTGAYENNANRWEFAKKIAAEKGYKLGPSEHGFDKKQKEQSEHRELKREREMEKEPITKAVPEKFLDENYLIIWQRNRDEEFSFEGMKYLKERGIALKRDDFEAVYIGEYEKEKDLEDIYSEFQNEKGTPEDYHARSLSVGDVVTINNAGKESSYFVDTLGFKEVKDFADETFIVNGFIHNKPYMTKHEIDYFEDIYKQDINGDSKIGRENLAVDVEDRDLDGNGIADRDDRIAKSEKAAAREDDDDFVR